MHTDTDTDTDKRSLFCIFDQFRDGNGANFSMDTEKSDAVKRDILKAVAMRTRVLLEHFCKINSGEERANLSADDLLDDLKDAEGDFTATSNSNATENILPAMQGEGGSFSPPLQKDCKENIAVLLKIIVALWGEDDFIALTTNDQIDFELCQRY
jgi:hypothetical protein